MVTEAGLARKECCGWWRVLARTGCVERARSDMAEKMEEGCPHSEPRSGEKNVAHGVSRGSYTKKGRSPGGAEEAVLAGRWAGRRRYTLDRGGCFSVFEDAS